METGSYDAIARKIPLVGNLLLRAPDAVKEQAFDIHLARDQPVSICGREGVFFLRENGAATRALSGGVVCLSGGELGDIFVRACSQSVFSHEQELKDGYILMDGQCRVGVCGTAVLEGGRVKSLRDVSSMVFRIPREVTGSADRLFLEGVELSRGLLVIGEPSSGKTTLLRDLAKSLSMGKFQPARRVAVLDQRGEIGGEFDLGPCADVLRGYPKDRGFDIALRMLSPEIILCDELSPEDVEAVRKSVFGGVAVIASIHGDDRALRRPLCAELIQTGAFGTLAFLAGRTQPGEIARIERAEGKGLVEGAGRDLDTLLRPGAGVASGGSAEKAGRHLARFSHRPHDLSDRHEL